MTWRSKLACLAETFRLSSLGSQKAPKNFWSHRPEETNQRGSLLFLPFYLLKMAFSAKSRPMFWDSGRPKICFWHHFPFRHYVDFELMESNPFITPWILGGRVCSWDEYFFNFSSKINYWGLISLQKLIKISGSIAPPRILGVSGLKVVESLFVILKKNFWS